MIGKGVVLDTSVLIDFLRQNDKAETWYFKLASMGGELLISILTHTELHAGKKIWENKRVKQELDDLLSDIKVLPVSQLISAKAGRIRAQTGVELVDAIIAATAIENKLSLATLNQKHFVRIKGLRLGKQV